MGTTTEPGINSGKHCEMIVTAGEFLEIQPRVRQLMLANKHEWNFFCGIEDMLDFAAKFHLFVAPSIGDVQAAIVFSVEEYITGNVALNVLWSSGDGIVEHIPAFVNAAEQLAREHKAQKIVVTGREAFKKLLEPYGFTLQAVALKKDM